MKRIIRTDNNNLDFQALITELDAYLKITDGEDHEFYNQFNSLKKINNVVVAFQNEQAIGCGAFRKFDANTVEIKRMYVKVTYRGSGVANTVLSSLEEWASEEGFTKCVLETGIRQQEAIALYKKNGYQQIPCYGQYLNVENSLCFEKIL